MTITITIMKPAIARILESKLVRASSGGGGIVNVFPLAVFGSCAIISLLYMDRRLLSTGRTARLRHRILAEESLKPPKSYARGAHKG